MSSRSFDENSASNRFGDLLSMEPHDIFLIITSADAMNLEKLSRMVGLAWQTVGEWQRAHEGDYATGKPSPLYRINRIRQELKDIGRADLAILFAQWLAARDGYDLVKRTELPDDVKSLKDEIFAFNRKIGDFLSSVKEGNDFTNDELKQIARNLRCIREQSSRLEAAISNIANGVKK